MQIFNKPNAQLNTVLIGSSLFLEIASLFVKLHWSSDDKELFYSLKIFHNEKSIESMTLLSWNLTFISLLSYKKFHLMGLFQKKNRGRGVEALMIWNFQGNCIEEKARGIQGLIKKGVDFARVIKKNDVVFLGVWFLALDFPKSLTKFYRISRCEALFFFFWNFQVYFFFFWITQGDYIATVAKSKMESKFAIN